jgi:hypothetical protein
MTTPSHDPATLAAVLSGVLDALHTLAVDSGHGIVRQRAAALRDQLHGVEPPAPPAPRSPPRSEVLVSPPDDPHRSYREDGTLHTVESPEVVKPSTTSAHAAHVLGEQAPGRQS